MPNYGVNPRPGLRQRRGTCPIRMTGFKGTLDVEPPHKLHWEEYGNPAGVPVIVVHGGPGAACFPNHTRFFDPAKWRVILLDQRGCGRSTPSGCLLLNNTTALVADLEALRSQLGLASWVLFGGSWGVALSLAYAQAHPNRVAGMVLRGITLMRRPDVDWLFRGGGAHMLYPSPWRNFLAHLDPGQRADPVAAYYRLLTHPDAAVREAAARAWSGLEMVVGFGNRVDAVQAWDGSKWVKQAVYASQHDSPLRASPPVAAQRAAAAHRGRDSSASDAAAGGEKPAAAAAATVAAGEPALERFEGGAYVSASLAQALLTCHYCHHDAFLEVGQLLARAPALAHIPVIAVHGRQDHVCPAAAAYDLHLALPTMELRVVPGVGHSMYEAPMVHELVWAGERMHALLTGTTPARPAAFAIPAGALT